MKLVPAIDVRHGRAVRLLRGERSTETVYGVDPIATAQHWVDEGADMLHVVDLDAAFGEPPQRKLLSTIVRSVLVPVQVGGGVRSEDAFRALVDLGVARTVFGTVAVERPEIVETALSISRQSVVIGVDVKEGRVAVRGWTVRAEEGPIEFGKRWKDRGAVEFVYTNVSRDGAMRGLDVEGTEAFAAETGARVLGSGGVGRIEDLEALKGARFDGVIVGKALYEGAFTLAEAKAVLAEC